MPSAIDFCLTSARSSSLCYASPAFKHSAYTSCVQHLMHPECNSVCETTACIAPLSPSPRLCNATKTRGLSISGQSLSHTTRRFTVLPGYSPYFLYFGRQPICELDLLTQVTGRGRAARLLQRQITLYV